MKKLKIILQHSILYYVVLLIAFTLYFISNNLEPTSVYQTFNNELFIITNINSNDYGVKLNLKGKERVIGYIYCKKEEQKLIEKKYSLGDTIQITGKQKEISNNTVPNTFNYKKYLINNKVYNVIEITDIKKIKNSNNIFYKVKNILLQRSDKLKKSKPYINSLIFGVNADIDNGVMESYRENGISHLFAISGLHISVFILILSKIIDKLKIGITIKSLILILFLIFYMFITNFSMSVLRCSIFTILLLINKLLKLEIPSINLLELTLAIILFINPLNWNNIGLKYSFLVTYSLIKYSKLIKGGKVKQLIIVSLIAFLVSYPITVNNFYQVNFISIVYNLFFVPYVSFILLPLVLIAYIIPCLDSVLYFFINIIEISSQFLNQIEICKISMCKLNTLLVISYYVIIYKLFSNKSNKRTAYSLILILFFIINHLYPFKNEDYMIFLDVGQGDSAVISINNKVTMIDTGGIVSFDDKKYKYQISKNKTIPYLKSNGIKKIDNLVLTHGDYDHMGEAINLVNNFRVEKVIFNCGPYNDLEKELIKVLEKKKIKYYSCIKELNIDNNKLYFLQTKEYDNENDNSNVIYTELDGYKFMFMGDASITTEKEIMSIYNLPKIDVLKAGHHGSKTSSSKEFINEINPKYSIISVGKKNRYGHPNKEVLENLNKSKVYRTDKDGSIMFKIKNSKLKIETCSP